MLADYLTSMTVILSQPSFSPLRPCTHQPHGPLSKNSDWACARSLIALHRHHSFVYSITFNHSHLYHMCSRGNRHGGGQL